MKISLFYKHIGAIAIFLILGIVFLFGLPSRTFANSQTVGLLEPSSVPNFNMVKGSSVVIIEDDQVLMVNENPTEFELEVSHYFISTSGKIGIYEVKKGDTISEIADTFNISANTIRWENNLSANQSLKEGQKLNILPVTGVKHVVKKGDTISKIADKYDAEAEDILIFNDISSKDTLKEGDILIVPNGVIKAVVVKKTTPIISKNPKEVISNDKSSSKIESGYYIRPVIGRVTSPYGSRRGGFHYGVDFGNSRGTPVVTSASGVVVGVVSSCKEGSRYCGHSYGNYIKVEHPNGMTTMYAHLSKVNVSVGMEVSQGQTIGTLGNTGRSTGPHLHFEIINTNGATIRPPFK
jgi:murein DD-endopeptidase MepM/ murein hydrolase activator NlpD